MRYKISLSYDLCSECSLECGFAQQAGKTHRLGVVLATDVGLEVVTALASMLRLVRQLPCFPGRACTACFRA